MGKALHTPTLCFAYTGNAYTRNEYAGLPGRNPEPSTWAALPGRGGTELGNDVVYFSMHKYVGPGPNGCFDEFFA